MLDSSFHVTYAENGSEAIEHFTKNQFDIVLLDIVMPGMDGYAVIKELRKINKSVPVIAVTASAMPEDKKRILENGFTSFIIKPLEQDELIDSIERLIY